MTRRLGWTGAVSVLLWVLVWAPLLVVAIYSFNDARLGAGWRGFSLGAYPDLLENGPALRAAGNTLWLATVSTVVSTVLGTLLGHGLAQGRGGWCRWANQALQIPVLIPDIVLAVGLVVMLGAVRGWLGIADAGMGGMIVGHVTLQVPFVALVVRARSSGLDPAWAEAARDLGATSWQVFRHVTLPLLAPGVMGGALLAFTLSLDDFAISFFTGGPGTTTLPVFIYASARRGVTPDINALSTLLVLASVGAVLLARRFGGGPSRSAAACGRQTSRTASGL